MPILNLNSHEMTKIINKILENNTIYVGEKKESIRERTQFLNAYIDDMKFLKGYVTCAEAIGSEVKFKFYDDKHGDCTHYLNPDVGSDEKQYLFKLNDKEVTLEFIINKGMNDER